VSAKDKKTGKEQRIEIKASSGLTEEEIKRMIADAEAHREEDRRFHELVDARNRADHLLHAVRSALKEHGSKVPASAIAQVETAIADLESVLKGDDKDRIVAKTQALEQAAASLMAAAAAQRSPGEQAPGGAGARRDDVVDAEFTDVKDDR
ncbi:MAG: Hsp70 family protein, partial [Geminicoccaceae bacterium]|nr:Hsp70 family protein [Geminicoccaceae bacterium]